MDKEAEKYYDRLISETEKTLEMLKNIKKNQQEFDKDDVTTYIRKGSRPYVSGGWNSSRSKTRVQWNKWKECVYEHENGRQFCVKTPKGISILEVNSENDFQRVVAPRSTSQLILAKHKSDRDIGDMVLTGIANKIYTDGKGEIGDIEE